MNKDEWQQDGQEVVKAESNFDEILCRWKDRVLGNLTELRISVSHPQVWGGTPATPMKKKKTRISALCCLDHTKYVNSCLLSMAIH